MSPSWQARADVVIVGSGVAGLTAAWHARTHGLTVLVITKSAVAEGNTRWAQGGVAAVLPGEHDPGDSVDRHVADTMTAGAGLCDETAVRAILDDGPAAVAWLRRSGAVFDTRPDGSLARTREGGHSAFRVVHAGGDATGAEIERTLVTATGGVPILEDTLALRPLWSPSGRLAGLSVSDADGRMGMVATGAIVLATGGAGQLYAATTNPSVATADGLAFALDAGAALSDMEFVQFHPTVLFTPGGDGHRPLVTEAVRGEGAVLVDATGVPVMAGAHPLADLAPRDVVAAAITRRMLETGVDHVFLDATGVEADFRTRFPTVFAACVRAGIDPTREPIPVAPAAHYFCGGVDSTVDGRTGVPGLYVAGEVARTGLHGANRLASNSLLEGLVMGRRVAAAVARDGRVDEPPVWSEPVCGTGVDRTALQTMMSRHLAVGRDAAGMALADAVLNGPGASEVSPARTSVWTWEDSALTGVARAVLLAARQRTESRGAHRRADFPGTDPGQRRSSRVRRDENGRLVTAETVLTRGVA